MSDEAWMLDLIRLFARGASGDSDVDELMWGVERETGALRVSVNCSDVFAWGCADGERDDRWLDHLYWPDLWCARKRQMRPQGAYFTRRLCSPAVRELFADAGPQRQGGVLGDPDHYEHQGHS